MGEVDKRLQLFRDELSKLFSKYEDIPVERLLLELKVVVDRTEQYLATGETD